MFIVLCCVPHRCAVVSGCALSVFSIVILGIGMIVDGVLFGASNALDTCIDQDIGELYGDSSYKIYAVSCALDHGQTCACVNGADTDTCYMFNLESAKDCGQILTKLPALLVASVVFMVFTIVLVILYSVLTCKVVCCASQEDTDRLNGVASSSAPPAAGGPRNGGAAQI
jgi:hypothetical protein